MCISCVCYLYKKIGIKKIESDLYYLICKIVTLRTTGAWHVAFWRGKNRDSTMGMATSSRYWMLIAYQLLLLVIQVYSAKGGVGARITINAPIGQPAVFVRRGSPVLYQFQKELVLCGILNRVNGIWETQGYAPKTMVDHRFGRWLHQIFSTSLMPQSKYIFWP